MPAITKPLFEQMSNPAATDDRVKTLLALNDAPREVQLKPDAIGAWCVVIQAEDRMRAPGTDWVYVFEHRRSCQAFPICLSGAARHLRIDA
jgi:hypothetical protein